MKTSEEIMLRRPSRWLSITGFIINVMCIGLWIGVGIGRLIYQHDPYVLGAALTCAISTFALCWRVRPTRHFHALFLGDVGARGIFGTGGDRRKEPRA